MSRRVLVVGESGQTNDQYDAQAIASLVRAAKPGWHVKALRKPPLLAKSNDRVKLRDGAVRLAQLHRQVSAPRPYDALINHADTDDVEPSHEPMAARIEQALQDAGCPGYAAVCAWELEAWFFLWPEAIEDARPTSWVVPATLRGRDVGQFRDPKRILRERVLRGGSSPRQAYQERDAPTIAEAIAARFSQRLGSSRSFERFLRVLDAIESGRPAA